MKDRREKQRRDLDHFGIGVTNPGAVLGSEKLHAAGTEIDVRMGLQIVHLGLEPFRQGDVVAVHPGDKPALGHVHPDVQDIGQTLIPLPHVSDDPGIVIPVQDVFRIIGRTVVQDNQFEIGETLGQHAVDRLLQIGRRLVDGHQYGQGRIHPTIRKDASRRGYGRPGPQARW